VVIYSVITAVIPPGYTQSALLEEYYGFISLAYLYLALLAGPFCFSFRSFPYRGQFLKARRAIGVSAFYFAYLHTSISLFSQLGGFNGLTYLDNQTLGAIVIGFIALFIMLILTITSFDFAVEKLTFPKWKLLHRFAYLAGILVLAHVMLIGIHYSSLSGLIPQITFIALAFLLLLESPRLDKLLKKFIDVPIFGLSTVVILVISAVFYFSIFNPIFGSSGSYSFDIHAAHEREALQALQQNSQNFTPNSANRYTVAISADPANPQPNQDVTLHFSVFDAGSGNRVTFFRMISAKQMHLFIVDNDLSYFTHILPTHSEVEQDFIITTQFPRNGMYHLYLQFLPLTGTEQQEAFSLPVGQVSNQPTFSKAKPDIDKIKKFDKYTVSVNTHGELTAAGMSLGQQIISFTVKNAKTGKPVTTLEPYLGSFGQLTLINEKTFEIIHAPMSNTLQTSINTAGPIINFTPNAIYGQFTPGIYQAYAELNPDNHLLIVKFTMKVN
jgi:DMSO/TMAO reductase YedYZ heme-binding membrane subunit